MPHTFYCSTIECQKEVKKGGDTCDTCKDAMSYESSECPGCGEHILCGANGYCAGCWVDRFGVEDEGCSPKSYEPTEVYDHEIGQWTCGQEHKCSGEWDHDRGIRVCDFADEHECPQHKCTGIFDYEIGQWTCGQTDKHKCKANFDLESGLWECVNEKPHKCSDTWSYDYSPRDRYPPLPPSPIATADDEIDAIEEKLRTASLMTENQKADWEFLWHDAKRRRRQEGCDRNVRTRVE
jgi:hypothetical protein